MFKRRDLKKQAKGALKQNYWKSVLVTAVFMAFIGGIFAPTATNPDIQQNVSDTLMTSNLGTVIAALITSSVLVTLVAAVGVITKVFIMNVLEVGVRRFEIKAVRNRGDVSDIGYGFDNSYKRNALTMFVRNLYIAIGFCIFIIPGLFLNYQYRMVPFILAEKPNLTRKEIFAESKSVMRGNKWKAFILDISFIPWHILGYITFGIVELFYVDPYRRLTYAAVYESIKKK